MYQSLLAEGRPVQIRTFHSWFAALLRTAPMAVLQQLGLPGAYELLEDDVPAMAEVWRPFLRGVAADAALRADFEAIVQTHGRSQTLKGPRRGVEEARGVFVGRRARAWWRHRSSLWLAVS